jgi:hypothetical protein
MAGFGCGRSGEESAATLTPTQAAGQLDEAFAAAPPEVQRTIQAAAEALKEGDAEKAVVALEVARSSPTLTLEQGLAVHDSLVALEANLINAAAAGDAKAQRAYELLKKAKRN